jgi:acyl-CoA thioesterase FadM
MFSRGRATVTVEMKTKFRHPVLAGRQAIVSAKITRSSHPLYLLAAEIIQDGEIKATANGKFYDPPDLVDVLESIS